MNIEISPPFWTSPFDHFYRYCAYTQFCNGRRRTVPHRLNSIVNQQKSREFPHFCILVSARWNSFQTFYNLDNRQLRYCLKLAFSNRKKFRISVNSDRHKQNPTTPEFYYFIESIALQDTSTLADESSFCCCFLASDRQTIKTLNIFLEFINFNWLSNLRQRGGKRDSLLLLLVCIS